ETMWRLLVLLLSAVAIEARVSFAKSEVLDNVDLQGTNKAAFRCSAGCRIFSPTKTDQIVVIDGAGNKVATLRMLSEVNLAVERFDLPAGSYELKNVGPPNPSFVFYAVEVGAANFETEVHYLDDFLSAFFSAEATGNITLLSTSGTVSFYNFLGFSQLDSLPTIYAAGFDSADACRPVFTARSAVGLSRTAFVVNSPIATVMFDKPADGRWVLVNSDTEGKKQLTNVDSSAVYTTPGYVGCPSVGDALYSLVPPLTKIDADATLTNDTGLHIIVNGDYSIADQADALSLTINDDVMKLYGKNSISKSYDGSKVDVKLAWKKNEKAKDAFAVQIDVSSTG
ncbi:hypothetical protein PMAYCL1PPCAC_21745, partial [Pristionchus mayeri]